MNTKLFSTLLVLIVILAPHKTLATDSDKTPTFFLTVGASYLTNDGFEGLTGPGRTVDGNDDATYIKVGYYVTPSLSLEGGIMNFNEITSSMYISASGTLHGKSYSVSQGCGGCGKDGPLDLKGEFETSYLFGFKYSPFSSSNLGIYIKAGMLFWDVAYTATGAQFTYDGVTKSGRFLEIDGSDAYFAAGVSYSFINNSSINFDFLSSEIHNSDISGPSLSWIQSF